MNRQVTSFALLALLAPLTTAAVFAQTASRPGTLVSDAKPIRSVQAGAWSSASTWSDGEVPDPKSNVTIEHDVNLDSDVTVEDVTMTAGSISGPGDLTVTRSFDWNGGALRGAGREKLIIGARAKLDLGGASEKSADGRSIVTGGRTTWTGGSIRLTNGATVQNLDSGTLDIKTDGRIYNGCCGNSEVINAGTLRTSDRRAVAIDVPFTNSGAVDVRGSLRIMTMSQSGTPEWSFDIGGGAQVSFASPVSLTGTLKAGPADGFVPQGGEEFTIITAPSVAGGFQTRKLSFGDGRTFSERTTSNAVILTASGPVITSIQPASGPETGGTRVTLSGSGFVAGSKLAVNFGGAAATGVELAGGTIVCITPPHATGNVAIALTNGDGQPTTFASFRYETPPSCTPPQAVVSAPTSVCEGAKNVTASVGETSGATYRWTVVNGTITSGQGTPAIRFNADTVEPVTLRVEVAAAGCSNSGTATVAVTRLPATPQVSNSGPACEGGTVTLNASAVSGATYSWTGPNGFSSSQQNPVLSNVTAAHAGTYVLQVSSSNCSVPATTDVRVLAAPQEPQVSNSGPACEGGTVTLNASAVAGATYSWSGPNGFTSSEQNPVLSNLTAANAGTYVLLVKAGGCSSVAATTTVAVTPAPVAAIAGPSAICAGSTAVLDAGPGFASYRWSTGETTRTISVSPRATQSFRVTVASESGCEASAAKEIVVYPLPAPPALTAPADGAEALVAPVTLQWKPVEGASSYEVWLDSGSGFAMAAQTAASNLTVNAASGTTRWYVVAQLAGGCAPLRSATSRFTVAPAVNCSAHGTPELRSPAPRSTVERTLSFSWTGVAGAAGYRVIVRLAGGAPQVIGTTTATTLEATLPAGAAEASVEALFDGCPATVSAIVSFVVAGEDPCTARPAAALISPTAGATLISAAVTFNWTAVAGAAEYRVMSRREHGEAVELGRTKDVSLPVVLEPGAYTWWVETVFKGCAASQSESRRLTIPTSSTCSTAPPLLVAPLGGSTAEGFAVEFVWTPIEGAIGYEVWVARAEGVPTLLASAGAGVSSATAVIPSGPAEWFVRAYFSSCPAVESRRLSFTARQPEACADLEAPLILGPTEGEAVTSPATFAWTPVAGATGYEVFVLGAAGESALVREGPDTTAVVTLAPGDVRWFVRARLATCGWRDSTPSSVRVVARPQPCDPLEPPVLTAPAEISSGVPFSIRWSEAPGATSYEVQLSPDADFRTVTSTVVDAGRGNRFDVEQINAGAAMRALFARVRALDRNCAQSPAGMYSPTAVVYVLPQVTRDVAMPLGGARSATWLLPLGADLAGRSFSVTAAQPWLTVNPSSGVVPAGGTFLSVITDARDLPPGTSNGAVMVTLGDPGALRVASQGGTTLATNVSISIASPVTSTARTSPPPDALIIPAVAHASGIGAEFRSDVRLTNTSAQARKYLLTFVPSGQSALTASQQTTVDVGGGATLALDDVLRTWFAAGNDSTSGTLEIRPMTLSKVSPAPPGALQNLSTFASSRMFNLTSNGTFGQSVPAIPFARFVGKTDGGLLSLQQIAQSARFRTNLGFVEGSGEPASLLVSVFGSGASKLAEFPVELAGGQHLQLNSILTTHGVSVEDGRVEVRVLSSTGKVTAYASVIDNRTNDPLLVSPQTISGSTTTWVVPGVADLAGATASWRSDVRIFNAGASPVEAELRFHSQNGGEPKRTTLSLAPGEVRVLDRVLASTFAAPGDAGAVHVQTSEPAQLTVTARTYNETSMGTYGQFIPAITPAEAAGVGMRPLQILQAEQSDRFRTNVGLAEVTGKPIEVEVTAIVPGLKVTPTMRATLAANEFRQLNSLLAVMGLGETHNARLTVRAVSGGGRVAAYASVIDARTQDPTYVPAQ